MEFDLVIRNGTIFDGRGGEPYVADIAIAGGLIAAIGAGIKGDATRVIDAAGHAVTPGFVDIHTHYDGQATWSDTLAPSSDHGVTTVLMGNCGVGFAPCKPADRDTLVELMEGVEDIPEIVMAAGIPWQWETFEEYLDFLDARRFDVDVAAQLPHAPLRVYVMGARAANIEDATDADIAQMKALTERALRAGAIGFSTTRSVNHRSASGELSPSYHAAENELLGIASALKAVDGGVLQGIADLPTAADATERIGLFRRLAKASGRPTTATVVEFTKGGSWRAALDAIDAANAEAGVVLRAQVFSRPVGLIFGLELSRTPFSGSALYEKLKTLPLSDRVLQMRKPEVRATILAEAVDPESSSRRFELIFPIGEKPDYEPAIGTDLASMAARTGVPADEIAYDALLEHDGHGLLLAAFGNYLDGSLDNIRQMLTHPHTVVGLGDGGAHYGLICDSSFPTHLLSYWGRDRTRGARLSLPFIVKTLTLDNATAVGFNDRGIIEPGYKADINVIDLDRIELGRPEVVHDLPSNGARMRQSATGYLATIVSGVVTRENDRDTGARPGRLVRGKCGAIARMSL